MSFFSDLRNFVFSKKFLINTAMIIGVNVLIGVLLMLYLNKTTHNGQKISVPNLYGKHINQAGKIINQAGLEYEVLDSVYRPDLPEGIVVSQDPRCTDSTDIFVKEGRIVKVRVSKKTRVIEMPNLVHKSERFAESVLSNRGLKYVVTYESTSESDGAVLRQSYRGKNINSGTKIPVGATVHLVVGKNMGGQPFQIPNLLGLTISEVYQRLSSVTSASNIFTVYNNCVTKDDSLNARVMSQTPEYIEGIMTSPNATITVILEN